MNRSTSILPANFSSARRRVGALGLGAALAATLLASPAGAAGAADGTGPTPCPKAYPAGTLTAGQEVTGLTVSSGTAPDTITGTYVGTLDDGIAPGVDMLIFKMSGSKITGPGGDVDRGIWAGMSGSPLYAEDGRLVGAISYGLSMSPSDYAGVTPAAAMYALRDYTKPAPKRVALSRSLTAKLRLTGATARESTSGLERLPMPLNVTAAGPISRVERIAHRTDHGDLSLRRAAGAGGAGRNIKVTAGSNLVDTISYGDVTMGSIGTATAVCGRDVIGFGHPDTFSGVTSLTMHGGDAVYIEKDITGSFKVANIGSPQGKISQDRLAGILGRLGNPPRTTAVTVTTTSPYHRYTGTSHNALQDYLSLVVGTQVMNDADVVGDRTGQGRASMTWTFRMQRPNGEQLTYQRSNVYSDHDDYSGTMPFEIASDVDTIVGNPFARVRVNSVTVHSSVTPKYQAYRVSQLDYRGPHGWLKATNKSVATRSAGQALRVRVTLTPKAHSSGKVHRFTQVVRIPKTNTRGKTGTLAVRGHAKPWWDYGTGTRGATSLPGLLQTMRQAPHNDTVSIQLGVGKGAKSAHRSYRQTAPSTVSGSRTLRVTVRK